MQRIKLSFQTFLQNPKYSMPLVISVWGVLYILFGAVINTNNGLGFDGATYGTIIKDFYNLLLNDKLSPYQIQRILPLFLCDLILSMFGFPKEDFYIIKFFQIYNLLLLIVCCLIWNKISEMYSFGLEYIWIGFVLAFVSFGIAEMTFYYPVLTDTTAFFLGFCLLYFHLKDNLTGKIIITILGAFTWPSFMYIGLLLIIFPVSAKLKINFSNDGNVKPLNVYIALIVPLVLFIASIVNVKEYFSVKSFDNITTPVFSNFLYIDAVLNLILMTYLFYCLLPEGITYHNLTGLIKNVTRNLKIKNILICIFIFTAVYLVQKTLSSSQSTDLDPSFGRLIYAISVYSVTKPLVYYVTAVTYFGPCFILLFLFMKYFRKHILEFGLGFYFSFTITLILVFMSETRLIINFLPFILLVTVLFLKDINLNRYVLSLLCIFSFILSKVYIPMYKIPEDNAIYRDYFSFPNQFFFMNIYTISKPAYVIQGIIILLMSVYIFIKITQATKNTKDFSENEM
ncbi:MAG: hypothetical protein IPL53_16370 [Ignavibacteria bacterium]|nr:hypothetical protein [Ignavibacteria bacterium]